MRCTKHTLPLLLVLAMLTIVLVGCDDTSDSETEAETSTKASVTETESATEIETETETVTEPEPEPEISLYTLTFTSNGDGTCYVSHVEFRENIDDREIMLVFPEKSPEGDTVTAIRYTTGDNLPRIISDEDFRHHIIAPLLEQMGVRPRLEELGLIRPGQDLAELDIETVPDDIFNTDSTAFPFWFKVLISWYGGQNGKKSLASVADEEARQELIEAYPTLIEHPDVAFWRVDKNISLLQIEVQCEMLSAIEYTPADAARDEAHMWFNNRSATVNYCNNIVAMEFPDTLKEFDFSILNHHLDIRSIQLPDCVTNIADLAFAGCAELASVKMPDSVTEIGNSAFYGCTGLTSITIPDSVTSIGNKAFYGCTGLTEITLPAGVTGIGNSAFSGCIGLTSIAIPDSVTSIGSNAFFGTAWYEAYCGDVSNWVSDMLYINSCLVGFKGGNVDTISIREGTTCIAGSVFSDCTGLTSIVIPDGVLSIGDSAFSNCTALKSITLPDSVADIGALAFSGCTQLRNVTFKGTAEQWRAISRGDDWNRNVPSYCKWHFSADEDISK